MSFGIFLDGADIAGKALKGSASSCAQAGAAGSYDNKRCDNGANVTGFDAHEVVDILSVWLHLKRRYGDFVAALVGDDA
ncbi:hypothetical protein LP421_09835 [Rhizobium sp. RCAM05350]|nr:hypothetical protein LP421_09835 [Rhizobium sp. RCAM05350]